MNGISNEILVARHPCASGAAFAGLQPRTSKATRRASGRDGAGNPCCRLWHVVGAGLLTFAALLGLLPLVAFAQQPTVVIGSKNFTESRSEEHTSELQSHVNLVCHLLLEKKKKKKKKN